jgi:hypothetical protein
MKAQIVRSTTKTLILGVVSAGFVAIAHAQLSPLYQFNGRGGMSLDGIGSNNTPVGNVLADVPVGSTVVQAFLFSSVYTGSSTIPDITLGSTEYSGSAWTTLPANPSVPILDAFVTNVTSQMQTAIGSGSASPFSFSVTENTNNSGTDGEILAIVYSNPADPVSTVAFLDGTLATTGATTTVNYSSPLTGVGTPGFSEVMSIGDGFSYQDYGAQQYSIINVDGRRLTSSAGGDDDNVGGGADGSGENGNLITVGGIGDSTANPTLPYATPTTNRSDDELYDLGQGNGPLNVTNGTSPLPFVSNGDTSTTITTINPSNNDNIFFMGLDFTAEGAVDAPPPPPPPR